MLSPFTWTEVSVFSGEALNWSSLKTEPWVGCVFLAWFNDAEAEWCASEPAKVLQSPAPGETGAPAACKNNTRGFTCT